MMYDQSNEVSVCVHANQAVIFDLDGVIQRRFVHMDTAHLAAMETTLVPENWSGRVAFRSALDGRVINDGVQRYRDLNSRHLVALEADCPEKNLAFLKVQTSQSELRIAMASRTRLMRDRAALDTTPENLVENNHVIQILEADVSPEKAVTAEKIVALHTSRDPAVAECGQASVQAAGEGLRNLFVTNGFMTPEAIDAARPWLDACNVDLKSFRDEFYKNTCHGRLKPVLSSIRRMKAAGIWVEITTLVVPNQNDSAAELQDIAGFIAGIDPFMPWHISRFHPDYRLQDARVTPVETMEKAFRAGKAAGLAHIYPGNLAGADVDTVCPHCGRTVIRRSAFGVQENQATDGRCVHCRKPVAGVFE